MPATPPRHHRLAGAGRADHQHVVAAGRGDFERAPRERLTADVGEVRRRRRRSARRRRPASPGAARECRPDRSARRPPRRASAPDRASSPSTTEASPALRTRQQQRRRTARGAPRPRSAARRAPAGSRRRATARRAAATSATSRRVTSPVAARMPSAIGRSNDEPALRMSAGARLTVTRCGGNSKPELRIALRTRSRLSRTLASGRPTIAERRQAERDVDLDLHRAGLDPEDRRRAHAGEHARGAVQGARAAARLPRNSLGIGGGSDAEKAATREPARAWREAAAATSAARRRRILSRSPGAMWLPCEAVPAA